MLVAHMLRQGLARSLGQATQRTQRARRRWFLQTETQLRQN